MARRAEETFWASVKIRVFWCFLGGLGFSVQGLGFRGLGVEGFRGLGFRAQRHPGPISPVY